MIVKPIQLWHLRDTQAIVPRSHVLHSVPRMVLPWGVSNPVSGPESAQIVT